MNTFFSPDPIPSSGAATLGEDAAHHARVRRLDVGAPITLVDGAGMRATGSLIRIAKAALTIDVVSAEKVSALEPIHLLVPIGDRDRMLWLAEKATELGVTSWRPVMFKRSKSVSPRGEGLTFQARVRTRMVSALEQSNGGWLPTMFPEATLDRAIAAAPGGTRVLLDTSGEPAGNRKLASPVTIALGPEGGLDGAERDAFVAAAFTPVTLGRNILRFETAAIAGIAIARAALLST
jgi:16S rRNA (uracil1498-N3)-methyltransferase